MSDAGRRICVTGGRDFQNRRLVELAFERIRLSPADTLVEGEAQGADSLCAEVAAEMGAKVEPHPAKWRLYGGAAGTIRNTEMLESGIDLLLSFPGGRGTRHCVNKATEMGIPVTIVCDDGRLHAQGKQDDFGRETRQLPCEENGSEGGTDATSQSGWESLLSADPIGNADAGTHSP